MTSEQMQKLTDARRKLSEVEETFLNLELDFKPETIEREKLKQATTLIEIIYNITNPQKIEE